MSMKSYPKINTSKPRTWRVKEDQSWFFSDTIEGFTHSKAGSLCLEYQREYNRERRARLEKSN